MIKNINSIACLIFTLLISSCKDGGCNVVLHSVINETLSLEKSLQLAAANVWIYSNGGGCGLIVYNTGSNVVAYDRCSTMPESANSKVQVEGLQIVDHSTGAKWLLLDGSPIHMAECSLRRYQVRKSGNLYVITN